MSEGETTKKKMFCSIKENMYSSDISLFETITRESTTGGSSLFLHFVVGDGSLDERVTSSYSCNCFFLIKKPVLGLRFALTVIYFY